MKILLDECITKRMKNHLNEFEVFTVTELGWSEMKSGSLMALCTENNFDILLTINKNMFQQNMHKYISIVIFDSLTSKIEELKNFLPSFKSQLGSFKKHKAYIIER